MKKLFRKIQFLYIYVTSGIGFYPTLISLLFFLLAVFMIYLETTGLSENLHEKFPFLIITEGDTAKTILSSIITGVISLTVFSFTMVMLVLNQAGSNFTPRVIPGLISYKGNQNILGFYLGTLVYSLIVLVNIRSENYYEELPGLSVFLAMVLMIICLALFVYFIHTIAQSIQIDNILETIHGISKNKLKEEIKRDKRLKVPVSFQEAEWVAINSSKSGYVQSIDLTELLELCVKEDILLEIINPLGSYVMKDTPLLRVNAPLHRSEEFCDKIAEYINFKQQELPEVNYLYGFKQITESAVKAMSPSLNDPGTALKAIDYLGDLFALRMQLTDEKLIADEQEVVRIRFSKETYNHLFTLCFTSIRMYSKEDTLVIMQLFNMIKNLLYRVQEYPSRKAVMHEQALIILHDTDKSIQNPGDRRLLNGQLQEINDMQVFDKPLPLLTLFD